MKKNVSLSICDEQLMLMDSLRAALIAFDDISIVGLYTTYKSTTIGLSEKTVDVAIIDLTTCEDDHAINAEFALNTLKYIEGHKLKTKVIILASTKDSQIINHLVKQGVSSFLSKNVSVNVLKVAIDNVYNGETFFSREVRQELRTNERIEQKPQVKLSNREKEVLQLVSTGYSTPNIAEQLKLHKDTISDYRESLMKKLRAKNAADLVRIAYENKIL